MATSSLDRVRDLVARLTPEEIRDLAERMDPEDLEVLEQVVMDTYVIEADAFDLLGYEPNPGPQTELHRLPIYQHGGPFDVLYGGAAFGGKALAVDTPIPVPGGWVTMGELSPGDTVFDEHGAPCRVLAATDVMTDRKCWRVEFDDGSTIVADDQHLWSTWTTADRQAAARRTPEFRARRRATRARRGTGARPDLVAMNERRAQATLDTPSGSLRTTGEIAATLAAGHAVPVAGALDLPDRQLPLDPWVLGVWLGDGTTTTGIVTTADQEVVDEIVRRGWGCRRVPSSSYGWRVVGLSAILRSVGVLGSKRIPVEYLRASRAQRLDLLRGLMDSDGYAAPDGSVEFTTTSPALAEQVLELVLSLGHKVTAREGTATLDGRVIGPKWRLKWMAPEVVFTLPRRAVRQRIPKHRARSRWRRIIAVVPVDSVPVKCIEVTSPSRLYLAGRTMIPTHNSFGLLHDALAKAHQYPGLEVWLVRETYPQLYDSFISILERRLGYARVLGAKWNGSRHELRLPNGSVLRFRHARSMKDAADMLSAECQYLIIDERTRMNPNVVEALVMRVRSGDPTVPIVGVRSGSNPGGPGHSTVKQQFIDPAPLGWERVPMLTVEGNEIDLGNGMTLDAMFVPSKSSDNPAGQAADPTYVPRLNLLSTSLRAAYRDGDWSRFEGMRFERFDPRLHIADPRDWPIEDLLAYPRALGIDYGSSAPFAAIWLARIRSDLVVAYRELHLAGLTPTEQAEAILSVEIEGERDGNVGHIDPSTFARNPEQPRAPRSAGSAPAGSIASRYMEAGVQVRKAHNDRVTGWSLIDELLAVSDEGETGLVILSSCPNLIRSLSGAPRDEKNPEDVDGKYQDDHAADAARYGLLGLLGGPSHPAPSARGTGRRAAARTVPTGVQAR